MPLLVCNLSVDVSVFVYVPARTYMCVLGVCIEILDVEGSWNGTMRQRSSCAGSAYDPATHVCIFGETIRSAGVSSTLHGLGNRNYCIM